MTESVGGITDENEHALTTGPVELGPRDSSYVGSAPKDWWLIDLTTEAASELERSDQRRRLRYTDAPSGRELLGLSLS